MQLFFIVQQKIEKHQQQEHAAKSCDFRMVLSQMACVFIRIIQTHIPHFDQANVGGKGNDQQGKQQAHAKHRDHHAQRQEQALPELIPVF